MRIAFKRHPGLKRLGKSWRRPKGDQNKSRRKLKGKPIRPIIGFGTSVNKKGLHPSGLREMLINNLKELEALKDGFAARIASTIGKRKRTEIIALAEKKKIHVLNKGVKKK